MLPRYPEATWPRYYYFYHLWRRLSANSLAADLDAVPKRQFASLLVPKADCCRFRFALASYCGVVPLIVPPG
jgi:hypothetical protein